MAKPQQQPPTQPPVPPTPLAKVGAPFRAWAMEETRRGWQLIELTIEGDKVTARKNLDEPNLRAVAMDRLDQILRRKT